MSNYFKGITSRIFRKKEKAFARRRMKICNGCVHNSKNKEKSFKDKFFIFLNAIGDLILFRKGKKHICTLCKCNLELKTRDKYEDCGMVTIGLPSKWKYN